MLSSVVTNMTNKFAALRPTRNFLVITQCNDELVCLHCRQDKAGGCIHNYHVRPIHETIFWQELPPRLPIYCILPDGACTYHEQTLPLFTLKQVRADLTAQYHDDPTPHAFLLRPTEAAWLCTTFNCPAETIRTWQNYCACLKERSLYLLPSLEPLLTIINVDNELCHFKFGDTELTVNNYTAKDDDALLYAFATACFCTKTFYGFLPPTNFLLTSFWRKAYFIFVICTISLGVVITWPLQSKAAELQQKIAQQEEQLNFWQYTGEQKRLFDDYRAQRQRLQKALLARQQKAYPNSLLCREISVFLPKDIQLHEIERKGAEVLLKGTAKTTASIEKYRHSLQSSPCCKLVRLTSLKQTPTERCATFSLQLTLNEQHHPTQKAERGEKDA